MAESEPDLIERATVAAARLEQANKVMEELLKRQESIEARRVLGGMSQAGAQPVELSQAEKDAIDMKQYFKGTAVERAFK